MSSTDDAVPTAFTADDALTVARHLQESPSIVLVGGQSLNFWAEQFRATVSDLESLAPFQSRDIDFLGSVADVEACAKRLGGSVAYPTPDHIATPEVGIVHCVVNGKKVRIDFLGYLAGVDTNIAKSSAIPAEVEGVVLRVLHPVVILQSRLSNIFILRRRDPLALRQMRVSIYVAREYIRIAMVENQRIGLDLLERVFEIALSDKGKKLWFEHNIDLFEAIRSVQGLPSTFASTRLPQMEGFLAKKREHYKKVRTAIAERKRAKKARK